MSAIGRKPTWLGARKSDYGTAASERKADIETEPKN
jgi:hypothetical protein